ncbi:MAG: COX15/CtaA family protein [Ardenticatenaceae bacterium]|nr:COX15/CtaA family protein [Ardenticatenaceae bacterium]
MKQNRFASYAWSVLVYNLTVILWGAYVRATGSGAGCGSHWPLCQGEVVPRSPRIETIIEFTHRLSSGLALALVVGLLIWAVRAYPKGHRVRLGAGLAMLLMITEALLGAGLVLFKLVAENASMFRAVSVATHLANTFLLLAALTLTAWWASGGAPVRLKRQGGVGGLLGLALLGVLVLGVSGAVTALGDTLFPSGSLAAGLRQDFSPTAHFLIRLRLLHPVIAVSVGLFVILTAGVSSSRRPSLYTTRLAWVLTVLFLLQLGAGLTNVVLLAPVWLQLVHLLLADLVWIALVLLAAAALAKQLPRAEALGSLQPAPPIGPAGGGMKDSPAFRRTREEFEVRPGRSGQ